MRVTRGSVALAERLKKHGEQTKCSKRTGIAVDRISRFTRGEYFPWADEATLLEKDLAIPVAWWSESPCASEIATQADPNDTIPGAPPSGAM